jgi:hypothetical protein
LKELEEEIEKKEEGIQEFKTILMNRKQRTKNYLIN